MSISRKFSLRSITRRLVLLVSLVTVLLQGQSTTHTPATQRDANQVWWKHSVIYEIYPRSYGDSNGDGIGDLNGITEHLDYVESLGVGAIWIAPMYPSPQIDFGYDISDYENIDPQFGTLADFDRLLAAATARHIHVIVDMVLNHTSDKHAWFIESAGSRTNSKANWYVWSSGLPVNDPTVGAFQKRHQHDGMAPPNNWVSIFGGSAWEWVPARKQFYYHRFYKQQPDLNWRNPAVEKAMFDVLKFWLDRGVSGFRLDAIATLFEDPQLRSSQELGRLNELGDPELNNAYVDNLPEVHAVVRKMRTLVDSYPGNRVLMGETAVSKIDEVAAWYGGKAQNELQLPMDFLLCCNSTTTFSASHFRQALEDVETKVNEGQPVIVFDNHDQTRSIDRFADGVHDVEIAKATAAILLMTKATPLTYYGAEIGMRTTTPTRKEDVQDPVGITGWPKNKGRDGERTPMQWTAGPQAGFSSNPHTWLPIPSDYMTVNVEAESADPDSLLNWFKQLIILRNANAALRDGRMVMLDKDNANVLSFARTDPSSRQAVVIAVNMSAEPQTISLDLRDARLSANSVKTLATSSQSLAEVNTPNAVVLPAFASWIASVR